MLRDTGLKEAEVVGLAVRHHHERFDGAGYPDGLVGEAIPFMARIIAIADAYDAMAAPRIYGRIRPHAEIVAVLREERGRQHDPFLSDRFLEMIEASPFRASAALESAS